MKVKELIEILQSKDQNLEIFIYDEEYNNDVPIGDIYKNDDGTYIIVSQC